MLCNHLVETVNFWDHEDAIRGRRSPEQTHALSNSKNESGCYVPLSTDIFLVEHNYSRKDPDNSISFYGIQSHKPTNTPGNSSIPQLSESLEPEIHGIDIKMKEVSCKTLGE